MPLCDFCKMSDDAPVEYGEFMKKSGICVHYYCLLSAKNLPQNGADHSGILGFLLRDIRNEISNASKRKCYYCKKPSATVACNICNKYFHQICGNSNGCVSEYVNEFFSYCHQHVPFKKESLLSKMPTDCWICKDPLGEFYPTMILRAYCCNNGYVHRTCMRKYALSAGYYLRCLWCGKKDFRDDIRKHGVFVPDREAQWDNNETLRFVDLHRGYSRCDAKICHCPQGREYFVNKWKLQVCTGCGASGIHKKCAVDMQIGGQYTCSFCNDVLNRTAAADELRKNNCNGAFNYTLYISKTLDDSDFPFTDEKKGAAVKEVAKVVGKSINVPDVEKPVDVGESATVKNSATASHQPTKLDKKVVLREMYMFGRNHDIIGLANVLVDNELRTEKVVHYSHSDRLLQSVFEEIIAEGRQLTTDDQTIEDVMRRLESYLQFCGVGASDDDTSNDDS